MNSIRTNTDGRLPEEAKTIPMSAYDANTTRAAGMQQRIPYPPAPPARAYIAPAPERGSSPEGESVPWAVYIGAAVGIALALAIIPAWVPVLGGSLANTEPKAFWYLSRASGLTAFVLLWISMASGLIITNKMARVWPGPFQAFDLHQFTSLLGLGFAVFHVVVLLGEHYIGYNLVQLLVPFGATPYRPFWVGLGQVALYLMIPVTFTFYFRRQIGTVAWRAIHLASYVVFGMALFHGLGSGTDSTQPWAQWMYALGGVSMLGLTAYRLIVEQGNRAAQERRASTES